MPTILDATVVARVDDTSGNGGRKFVRTANGNMFALTFQANFGYHIFKVDASGNPISRLCYFSDNGTTSQTKAGGSIVAHGNNLTISIPFGTTDIASRTIDTLQATDVSIYFHAGITWIKSNASIDTAQTALGTTAIEKNVAGTELHATWVSKNAGAPTSFNIRYSKATINADGSLGAWGAVVQTTAINSSGYDFRNPTLTIDSNGKIHIIADFIYSTSYYIMDITNVFTSTSLVIGNPTGWGNKAIYSGGTYAQSSPSAIFVPQSVNGLANGRIWVAWHGTDSTDTGANNIRTSYSDDGGVTWNAMQKLTSGTVYSQLNASLTADKNNKVYLIFQGIPSAGNPNIQVRLMTYTTSWSAPVEKTSLTVNDFVYPSALFDLSLSVASPLFIYKNHQTASVKFSGTWTTTDISVTQGSIGQKTDRANVLTYAITTDGVMSTITEKVNGVTIGTKTATSGQSLIAGLTQVQWDAVKFGKYQPHNILGSDGNFDDLSKFAFTNGTGVLDNTRKTSGSNSVKLTKTSATTSFVSTNKHIYPMAGDCYIAIADLYLENVSNYAYMTSSTTGVTRNTKNVTSNSGTSYSATSIGQFVPIISAYQVTAVVSSESYFKPSVYQNGVNGQIFNVDSFRFYKISKTEYDELSLSVDLATARIIAEKYPYQDGVTDNTLTVQMDTETFTYTFDKRPASDADMLSVTKAVQDSANVYLPAVKSKLGTAIRAKGGTVNDADSLEVMVSAVGGITLGKKFASGTITGDFGTVTGLTFKPKVVMISQDTGASANRSLYNEYEITQQTITTIQNHSKAMYVTYDDGSTTTGVAIANPITVTSDGFSFNFGAYGHATLMTYWYAFE